MSARDVYDLTPVRLPRLRGWAFQLFVQLLESPILGAALTAKTLSDMEIARFRSFPLEEPPTFQPLWPPSKNAGTAPLPEASGGRAPILLAPTIEGYAEAYRSGRTSPEDVAGRALAAIEESDRRDPPLSAFLSIHREDVIRDARASAARWKSGEPLSPIDGVPIGVKDEFDVAGHVTKVGTSFLGVGFATEDATCVARLRAAGAVVLGKTNMHEIGIGVTGFNRHHGTPRNPHAPDHYTGGSSSGSAAAVAAGICPLAVSADAGGSIRIPAALCGVVGLKPTFGRVSSHGTAPLAWSLDHYGPIALSARDAALGYVLMAGADPKDPTTQTAPPPTLEGLEDADLSGLVAGVYRRWFDDADPRVVKVAQRTVDGLKERGLRVVEIEIPELGLARIAHLVLVATEMAAAMSSVYGEHRHDFGLDVRANLALAKGFTARDYVRAQRTRTRAMAAFARVLAGVDVILTPTTGLPAPLIRGDVLPLGESDLTTLLQLMNFVVAANLTGLPAITFPAGYEEGGLPVGLQAIGRPWHEHVLLRIARTAEGLVERRKPAVHFGPEV